MINNWRAGFLWAARISARSGIDGSQRCRDSADEAIGRATKTRGYDFGGESDEAADRTLKRRGRDAGTS